MRLTRPSEARLVAIFQRVHDPANTMKRAVVKRRRKRSGHTLLRSESQWRVYASGALSDCHCTSPARRLRIGFVASGVTGGKMSEPCALLCYPPSRILRHHSRALCLGVTGGIEGLSKRRQMEFVLSLCVSHDERKDQTANHEEQCSCHLVCLA